MIFYSRSVAGWFIILIFHGRIMFITIGKKKCCPVSILNLFFEIQSHVYMIVYSRSAKGWFIILIFHGQIMFITIGKKNVALFLF